MPGEAIHICDDPALAGKYDNLFVIDSPGFAAKLGIGEKITFNYGTIEMCVESFVTREAFFQKHADIEEIKIQKISESAAEKRSLRM